MSNDMENNRRVCQMEKEAREKRLLLYAEAISLLQAMPFSSVFDILFGYPGMKNIIIF